jgi:murein DD-endopeptidase MepM/ murein hydrolase activator NlpD
MKLELWYPVKPFVINQKWGVENDVYAKHFNDPTFKRHNGIDLGLSTGQYIRAPFDCIVTKTAYQEKGAGYYISLLSQNTYEFNDVSCRIEVTFMHCLSFVAKVGQILKVGDIIAVGDNTGFSTGSHTHMSCKRVISTEYGYKEIDSNDAKNTFDQLPYFNGVYAYDIANIFSKIYQQIYDLKRRLNML